MIVGRRMRALAIVVALVALCVEYMFTLYKSVTFFVFNAQKGINTQSAKRNSKKRMVSYRFLSQDTRVFVITQCEPARTTPFFKRKIYSEPYYSAERRDERNAIVGFVHKDVCDKRKHQIKQDELLYIDTVDVDLWELKCHADALVMPLIVYTSDHPESDDVFSYWGGARPPH